MCIEHIIIFFAFPIILLMEVLYMKSINDESLDNSTNALTKYFIFGEML